MEMMIKIPQTEKMQELIEKHKKLLRELENNLNDIRMERLEARIKVEKLTDQQ